MSIKTSNKINNISKNQQPYTLNDFSLQKKIGNGSFGKVYLAKLIKSGQNLIAKISNNPITENTKDQMKDLSTKVDFFSKLDHLSILKLIFYSNINFKGYPKPTIITEYAPNGSLRDLLELDHNMQLKDKFTDTNKLIIIYGIASAMSYLHMHKIILQDLSPASILLDDFLFPKIVAFGLSKIEDILNKSKDNENSTPIYLAPEVWMKEEYSEASDVYSFSLIVYEIVTKNKPFLNLNFFQIMDNVKKGLRPEITEDIPEHYVKLITSCWSQEPKNRPSFNDIVNLLKTDKSFITESVDGNKFMNYIEYIENHDLTIFSDEDVINIKQEHQKNDVNQLIKRMNNISKIYPMKEFNLLDERLQKYVLMAEENAQKQSFIGKSLIEGIYGFPQNTKIGLDYLKHSIKNGSDESLIYYCNMLIKGKIIPKDYKESLRLIQNQFGETSSIYYLTVGKVMKKINEIEKAKVFFNKSSELEAQYEYYKLLLKESKTQDEIDESNKIAKELISKCFVKAILYYGLKLPQNQFKEKVQCVKIAANKNNPKAIYIYSLLIEKEDNELSLEYLKKAADNGHINSIYKYASILSSNPQNYQKAISLFKQAANKGHVSSIYKYGLLLYSEAKTLEEKRNAARFIQISCSYEITPALFQYGTMNLLGDEIPQNKEMTFYCLRKAAEKDDANAYYYLAKLIYNNLISYDGMLSYTDYFQKAIQLGHQQSMVEMATIIFREKSTNSNDAVQLCKQAISEGNSDAMDLLAFYLQHGYYVDFNLYPNLFYCGMALENDFSLLNHYFPQKEISQNDRKIIFNLYKMAVGRKNVNAMIHLADMISNEYKDEAICFLKMAIENHSIKALTMYAKYLIDCDENEYKDEIFSLINRGINNNDSMAMRFYANILETGKCISQDYKKAAKYYQMAIDSGDLDANNDYALMIYNEIKDKPFNKETNSKIEIALKKLQNTTDVNLNNTMYNEFVSKRGSEIKSMITNLMNLNRENCLSNNDDKELNDKANLYEKGDFDHNVDDKSENDDQNQLSKSTLEDLYKFYIEKINHICIVSDSKSDDINTTLTFIHDYIINENLTSYIKKYLDANKLLKNSEDNVSNFINENNLSSNLPSLASKNSTNDDSEFETEFSDDDEELKKLKKETIVLQQRYDQINQMASKESNSSSNKLPPQSKGSTNKPKVLTPPPNIHLPQTESHKIKMLKKKSEQGDIKALIKLASCYSLGEGVKQDQSIAFRYCLKAAQTGDKSAQFLVATCYSYGKGTEIDKSKAFEFYLKSAEQDNPKSQFAVGYFYQYGQGGATIDKDKAKEWFMKAASQGHQGAIKILQKYFND